MKKNLSRREFLARMAAVSAGITATAALPSCMLGNSKRPAPEQPRITLKEGSVILFQGDSITDYGRDRDNTEANSPKAMGYGYAAHIAGNMLYDYAGLAPRIYNRGVSGNKVFQLRERWQQDCYDLKPDVLSILIGVNDFWHAFSGGYDGTPETYLRDYLALMEETKNRLPDLQVVICEPFALNNIEGGWVNDEWYPKFREIQAAAKEVADACADVWVPFQQAFDEGIKVTPACFWSPDGIHASMAGGELMARAWLTATGL